jgi:hypothetical protein
MERHGMMSFYSACVVRDKVIMDPRQDASHQFRLTPNFFKRSNSDVGFVDAYACLLAHDPYSLADTECWRAEAIQYEKKFGQFARMTCHLEPSTGVSHLHQEALTGPRPVDRHHSDIKRLLEYNPRLLSPLLECHHHAGVSFLQDV